MVKHFDVFSVFREGIVCCAAEFLFKDVRACGYRERDGLCFAGEGGVSYMVVYHGSDHEFDKLKICCDEDWSRDGHWPGVYFTDRPSEAFRYGKYIYEIEIPNGRVANWCSKAWRREYYEKFVKWMRKKSGFYVDLAARFYCWQHRPCTTDPDVFLDEVLLYVCKDDVDGFGYELLMEFIEDVDAPYSAIDDVTLRAYRECASGFDEAHEYPAFWFLRNREDHKGVIRKLSEDIRLLGRTSPRSGEHVDFLTGHETDLRDELDDWFMKAFPVLSDPDVDGSEKDRLVQEALPKIRLVSVTYPLRTFSFLRKVRNGKVGFDQARRFRNECW